MGNIRTLIGTLPLLLAGSLAGAATVWAPIACGCAAPWQAIAWQLGRNDLRSADELDPKVIADGIIATWRGKPVRAWDLPVATSSEDCVDAASRQAITCTWWIWESPVGKRGFGVVVFADADGVFEDVHVERIEWLAPVPGDGS
ncbi:hypothetical protein [Arenimonas composti]|uniref:Uncharacterized protein n=1 Tax=Arenimonas composti TR7-09 = DSM 18010 TaxID=1121013 RepID=A0A091BWJ3_9GAMM|nr:hypothetical protein [Arenimonas composti]KFN48715.1 hypothetical protein P873_13745 [Arenimonas composti TR7-09 = DSM 18010]